jgi:hypothetical protein
MRPTGSSLCSLRQFRISLKATIERVKMRWMVVEIHANHDAEESANLGHLATSNTMAAAVCGQEMALELEHLVMKFLRATAWGCACRNGRQNRMKGN